MRNETRQRLEQVVALREAGMTYQEIGDLWGVTHNRVRQIYNRAQAIKKRRNLLEADAGTVIATSVSKMGR